MPIAQARLDLETCASSVVRRFVKYPYLEHSDQSPEQVVKIRSRSNVFPILILERILASEQVHSQYTGGENKQSEQSQKCHHVVHSVDHHKQLTTQRW